MTTPSVTQRRGQAAVKGAGVSGAWHQGQQSSKGRRCQATLQQSVIRAMVGKGHSLGDTASVGGCHTSPSGQWASPELLLVSGAEPPWGGRTHLGRLTAPPPESPRTSSQNENELPCSSVKEESDGGGLQDPEPSAVCFTHSHPYRASTPETDSPVTRNPGSTSSILAF